MQCFHTLIDPASGAVIDSSALMSASAMEIQAVGSSSPGSAKSPSLIRSAYGINLLSGTGAGQTIAIIDAYRDPNIVNDLTMFDNYYGLPAPPSFTILNQNGGTDVSGVPVNAEWVGEIALDVEWAHAIAPGASIVLIEANSNSDSDLWAAVDTARNYPGVSAISMSFGGVESSVDVAANAHFTTPSGHTGITFVAATGDDGSPGSYPAYSPNVVAVGGTSLYLSGSTYSTEIGWDKSGGGQSSYQSKPSYQNGVNPSSYRQIPDVSFVGDFNTGVAVYDSYNGGSSTPWYQVGGTSLSAPCWAGLIAIADQLRAAQGLSALDGASQTLPKLYSLAASNFHDITSGNNGGYSAGSGYDMVTGIGTPIANLLVPALAIPPTPDLTIAKSHTGNFHPGDIGDTYTIIVSNVGGSATSGTVNVADVLPSGLTVTSLSGSGWTITGTLTASRSDALAAGASYPALTIKVNVAANPPSSVTNTATVSGGGDTNSNNNTASDPTSIIRPSDLTVTKSHAGNFKQGDTGDTYTILVANSGTGATVGTVTVVDSLPAGLTATAFSGSGWSFDFSTLTAYRSDPLAAGSSYPALTLTVSVAANAPSSVTNSVTVSGGGEVNTANDTANDPTTIVPVLPIVAGVAPSLVGGRLTAGATTLSISFNQSMLGADSASNYQLQSPGADGLLGTSDDTTVSLSVVYLGTTATLTFAPLTENVYRLTVKDSITNSGGVKLDGNGDGTAGGNWTSDFVVVPDSNALFASATAYSSAATYPMGLAVGDFNNDGKPDVAVADNTANAIGLLTNDGNGGYSSYYYTATGYLNSPYSVATGDFNKDGNLDLAVANYGGNNVLLFWGNGSGFATLSVLTGGARPISLTTGDFNNDGNLDLAVANYGNTATDGSVGLLTGNGAGGFTYATVGPAGNYPRALTAADFNGDGKLDLAVANYNTGTVGVLLNNGSGGFPTSATYLSDSGTTPHPRSIAVGDFNGDGKPDIVVGNHDTNTVGVLINNGNGTFPATAVTYASGGTNPRGVAVADFNGDGKLDIAVANAANAAVTILLGNGSGGFGSAGAYSTGANYGPFSVVVGDFNGDGHPDLAVSDSGNSSSDNAISILMDFYGSAPVSLTTPHSYTFDISTSSFGVGQLIQGTSNAFDGYGRLSVGGTPFRPSSQTYTTADSGRTLITSPGTVAGLTVTRKITVPNTGGEDFARTVDVFTNSTASDITTAVQIACNLGSNAATSILTTSSGDTVLTPADQWFVTGGGTGPTLLHYLHGPGGLQPAAVSLVGDNIVWTYNLTVAAGQTKMLAYFTIQAGSSTQAISQANALVGTNGFLDTAALGLGTTDLSRLTNFQFNTVPMTVSASDWNAVGTAGMTLKYAADGKLHIYKTGTTTDIVTPQPPANVSGISVTGRSLADVFTVESMGAGVPSLAIHVAKLTISQNNAIPTTTNVTIDAGILDFGARTDVLANLTLINNGQANIVGLNNPLSTITVQSGTLTTASIVADTLIIGGTVPAPIASTPAAENSSQNSPAMKSAAIAMPSISVAPINLQPQENPVQTHVEETPVVSMAASAIATSTATSQEIFPTSAAKIELALSSDAQLDNVVELSHTIDSTLLPVARTQDILTPAFNSRIVSSELSIPTPKFQDYAFEHWNSLVDHPKTESTRLGLHGQESILESAMRGFSARLLAAHRTASPHNRPQDAIFAEWEF